MLKKTVRQRRTRRLIRHVTIEDTLFGDDEREVVIGGSADEPKDK